MNAVDRMREAWLNPPDWDEDEPYIMSKIGDLPVQVFYSYDDGFCEVVSICDEQERDIPTRELAFHTLARLRQECLRECEE